MQKSSVHKNLVRLYEDSGLLKVALVRFHCIYKTKFNAFKGVFELQTPKDITTHFGLFNPSANQMTSSTIVEAAAWKYIILFS